MLRFFYVIIWNLFRTPYMISRMRFEADHPEIFSKQRRYELNQKAVRIMCNTGKITTVCYGKDNLPKEGGYMMYPNHQGKYDALAIIFCYQKPCSVVMDMKNRNQSLYGNL